MKYAQLKTSDDLDNAILQAEMKQKADYNDLKVHLSSVMEGFRVKNLIKDAISDIKGDEEITGGLLNSASALAAGYASKKIFEAGSGNKVRQLLGTAVMFGVSRWVNGNPKIMEAVSSRIGSLMKQFMGKSNSSNTTDTPD
jgi:hypothetical protein